MIRLLLGKNISDNNESYFSTEIAVVKLQTISANRRRSSGDSLMTFSADLFTRLKKNYGVTFIVLKLYP